MLNIAINENFVLLRNKKGYIPPVPWGYQLVEILQNFFFIIVQI
jgi:hypothetical protein